MFAFKTVCAIAIGAAAFFSPKLCAADGPSGAGAPDLIMKVGQAWMEVQMPCAASYRMSSTLWQVGVSFAC
jgi:hypothetical protein